MISEPPSLAGGEKLTVACASPAVAVGTGGAPGAVTGEYSEVPATQPSLHQSTVAVADTLLASIPATVYEKVAWPASPLTTWVRAGLPENDAIGRSPSVFTGGELLSKRSILIPETVEKCVLM